MKIKKIEFYDSCAKLDKLPKTNNAEVAFVGRSNVGKSSLLNNLCNRKIAFTSSTPGKTQLINFFAINDSFFFVDLPGYGYAKVPKSMKKDWGKVITGYLEGREQLKMIFFLLDIRRIPNEHDKLLNEWFRQLNDIKVVFILTKADKLSKSARNAQRLKISKELMVDIKDFLFYSSLKNIGKMEVLKKLDDVLFIPKQDEVVLPEDIDVDSEE